MDLHLEQRLSAFLSKKTADRIGLIERRGDTDPLITLLEYDSRKIKPGALYFALSGLHTDGHLYIAEAIAKGAAVIVHDAEIGEKDPYVVYLKVKDPRLAMSPLAAAFYGDPSRRLLVTGVTGTEGKSTTTYLIWQLLRLMGKKAGFFSTVQHSIGEKEYWNPAHQTTPEATVVQQLLWQMAENGCAYAVVEASSHGLSPLTNRLGDVAFDTAVFTTLTHEHLEFHKSFDQYRDDKANLFRALDRKQTKKNIKGATMIPEPFGIVNADDKNADYFTNVTRRETTSFSVIGKDADLSIQALKSGTFGNWYNTHISDEKAAIDIRDRLPGEFNVGNVLAALLVVSGVTGVPVREIAPLCPRLLPVRGRMTAIEKGQPFEVLVDYAHTPSSFETIFPPLRKRLAVQGRIISLFGSAGERDIQKRAEQGKIAAAWSDIIILTDEDPRGESPMNIIEDISQGVHSESSRSFKSDENLFIILDRPAAIRKALSLARAGDIVLLLGKGHENTIIYKDRVMPFDEIVEAEKGLEELL